MSNDSVVVVDGGSARVERRGAAIGAMLLVAALSALFFYKWGGSLRALQRVGATGQLGVSPETLVHGGVVASVAFYFGKIWPALVYGIVVGAVVRSTVSPRWITALLGRGGTRPSLAGAACGSPLMLCSCCVTPVFTGVYERGARLGPALSLMLASPGLNLAAIALTFLLMPLRFAVLRLAAALLAVLVLAPAVGRLHERTVPRMTAAAKEDPPVTIRAIAVRFVHSLAYMTFVTVPLIVAGVLVSAWLLPHAVVLSTGGATLAVVLVALAATLVALPTFFEIPFAFMLLSLGAPPGAAVALLVAGPIVNLPSMLVLARETNARVALSLGGGVWAVATVAGLLA
jgi:uncharacterized membrane protein YraQ (UPF0718 family)